jgi:hypothetical protein
MCEFVGHDKIDIDLMFPFQPKRQVQEDRVGQNLSTHCLSLAEGGHEDNHWRQRVLRVLIHFLPGIS